MLTKKAKYALNTLIYLSKCVESQPVSAKHIASENRIPSKFLESILNDLKQAGILTSVQGRGGGYFMRKLPRDITIVEIIRMFDGAIGLIPCATYQFFKPCQECEDIEVCKIRKTFKDLRDINVDFLRGKALSDLI